MTPPAASAAAAPAINPRRRTVTPRRPPAAPRRPRRVSGPTSPAGNPSRSPARGQTHGWAARAGRAGLVRPVGLAEAVATNPLLDRLIRGRIWIGVIAFALIGIVTAQLVLLTLNAGIGRSLERETQLQRENATLSTENSELAAGERVEAQAEHAGMELIPSGALSFLAAHPSSDTRKAATALSSAASTPAAGTGGQSETETATGSPSTAEAATSTAASSETTSGASESETAASTETETGATSASTAPAGATAETTSRSATTGEAAAPASAPGETTASGAGTETSSGGAGETASPSTSTATGGGTTGG